MTQAYHQRPSELLGIDWQENDWLEYAFDRAVMLYGRYVDNESEKTDKEGKPLRTIEEILEAGPIQGPPPPTKQDFLSALGNIVAVKP